MGNDPLAYSELLYQLLAKRLRSNPAGVGETLRLAKQDYFLKVLTDKVTQRNINGDLVSYYDAKVTAETTLYGLPMFQYTFPRTPPLQMTGVAATSTATVTQPATIVTRLSTQSLPAHFHPMELKPWNLNQISHASTNDTYYAGDQDNLHAFPNSRYCHNPNTSILTLRLGRLEV